MNIKTFSRSLLSILLVVLLLTTTIIPAYSAEDEPITIEDFSVGFVAGASRTDNGYVYTVPSSGYTGQFIYRVNYSFSGLGDIPPGAVEMTVPTQMFVDRDGQYATDFDIGLPHANEVAENDKEVQFVYEINGDVARIYNRLTVSAAQQGDFTFSYKPSKPAINYVDMQTGDKVHATLNINKAGNDYTAEDDASGVKLNTSAKIVSAFKDKPDFYSEWKDSWGMDKPQNADDYYYLIWCVSSKIEINQYYLFSLNDTPTESALQVLGYRYINQSKFSETTYPTVYTDSRADRRTDYVLTAVPKTAYEGVDSLLLHNKVTATLTPYDGRDEPTSAVATQEYLYTEPIYEAPTGQFWMYKNGERKYEVLEEMQLNEVDEVSVEYNTSVYGYSGLYTADTGADQTDPYILGQVPLTYTLEDGTFEYSSPISLDSQRLYGSYGDPADFNFTALTVNASAYAAKYDETTKTHSNGARLHETVEIYGYYIGWYSKPSVKLADYVIGSGFRNINSDYVDSVYDNTLNLKSGIVGWSANMTTTAFYARINISPVVTIFNNDHVKGIIKNDSVAYVRNEASGRVSSTQNGSTIFSRYDYGIDEIIGHKGKSSMTMKTTSVVSNKKKQQYEVDWQVGMSEIDSSGSVTQNSGIFYILLPEGSGLADDSVVVRSNDEEIDKSRLGISTEMNYKDSGRTMLKIQIRRSGQNFSVTYRTINSFESIESFGTILYSSAAYETGNSKIWDGRRDFGGSLSDSQYMAFLDPTTDAERFLYASARPNVFSLNASTSGLTKQVQSASDETPSYYTTVNQGETYMYQLRVANDPSTVSKNMIFFDSLENYSDGSVASDWHGTLYKMDFSHLRKAGVEPVLYLSREALSIDSHHDLMEEANGQRLWLPEEEFGDISEAKAFAVDCRKTSDGEDFYLEENQMLLVKVYMKAPDAETDPSNPDPTAYNNIYLSETLVTDTGEYSGMVHQDYTAVGFRAVGSFRIKKIDKSTNEPIENITFNLSGVSFYGTAVNRSAQSDSNGELIFDNIEKGHYVLTESSGIPDYLADHSIINVNVNGDGTVEVEDKEFSDGHYIIENTPRVHGALTFYKRDYGSGRNLQGAEFLLFGTSDYGNEIVLSAVSNENGAVVFDDIEKGQNYTLVETQAPDGYIPSDKRYKVICDKNGNVTIEGISLNYPGDSYRIYNKPYGELTVYKVDAYARTVHLSGAEFRLTRADSGTPYDKTLTTGSNGTVKFEKLEGGSYTLEETKAPENYSRDEKIYSVSVSDSGTVTVDGLTTNSLGYYIFPDERELNGEIKITKVWEDNLKDSQRKTPQIHISMEEPTGKLPTATLNRTVFVNSTTSWGNDTITAFEHEKDLTLDEVLAKDGVVKADDKTTNCSIYIWPSVNDKTSEKTVYWWADTEKVYLPRDSSRLFYQWIKIKKLDLREWDASKITSLASAFAVGKYKSHNYVINFYDYELEEIDITGWNTENLTNLSGTFANTPDITVKGIESLNTQKVTTMSSTFSDSRISKLDLSGWKLDSCTDISYMFADCSVEELTGTENWKESKIQNARYAFARMYKIKHIDLNNLDMSLCVNMQDMFACNNMNGGRGILESLEIGNWDVSSAVNMFYMFYNCNKLKKLDIGNWQFASASNLERMFYGCSSLEEIDTSNWYIPTGLSMTYTFWDCESLKSIDCSSWNTPSLYYTFSGCSNLREVIGSENLNITTVSEYNTNFSSGFLSAGDIIVTEDTSSPEAFPTLDAEKYRAALDVFNNSTGTVVSFQPCSETLTISEVLAKTDQNVTRIDTERSPYAIYIWGQENGGTTDVYWYSDAEKAYLPAQKGVTSILPISQLSGVKKIDMAGWYTKKPAGINYDYFRGRFTNLKELYIRDCDIQVEKLNEVFLGLKFEIVDLSGLNVSNVMSMASMFGECNKLKSLNLSGWDVSNVRSIDGMFAGCSSLKELDLSGWDVGKVKSIQYMFSNCSSLKSLKLNNWDLQSLKIYNKFLSQCSSLETLEMENWKIPKIDSLGGLFQDLGSLDKIDMSTWEVGEITNLSALFSGCRSLTSIKLPPGLDYSKVTYFGSMFNGCSSLTELDVSSWDVSNSTSFSNMFSGCSSLTELDLTSWNTKKGTNFNSMFSGCTNLETIYASNDFDTSEAVDNRGDMFSGCTSLTGMSGTTLENSGVNHGLYARIDFPGREGYFTGESEPPTAYDSEPQKWIHNGDNTWTYIFKVFDDEAVYHLWEDNLEGYTSDGYIESRRLINSPEITREAVITNTTDNYTPPDPDPEDVGSITVSKKVFGDDLARGGEDNHILGDFDFTIELSGGYESWLSGTKIFGRHVFIDGVCTFSLHDNQSVTFSDIPAGLSYSVTETPVNGFDVVYENERGIVVKDTNVSVSVENTWQGGGETNDFTLTKKVIGGSAEDEFNFAVLLSGLYPNFVYKLSDDTVFNSNDNGYATVNCKLKADDSVTFEKLPVGAQYRITESASDYKASYVISDAQNLMLIRNSADANDKEQVPLFTSMETVDSGEEITVTFTNEKETIPEEETTSMSVIKRWQGDNEETRPDSIEVYLYQNDDIIKSITLTADNNWRATVDKLPVKDALGRIFAYSFEEAAQNGYIASYSENNNEIEILNTKIPVGNVKLSKTVEGTGSDENQEFRFNLFLNNAENDPVTATYDADGIQSGAVSFVRGKATVTMKHADVITIKNIPAGYLFSAEEDDHYQYEISVPETGRYSDASVVENQTIECPFVNVYKNVSNLSVTKHVFSDQANDKLLSFGFLLTISNEGAPLNGTYQSSGTSSDSIEFTDGKAEFSLTDGQEIIIKGLPVGAEYKVEEIDTGGKAFITESSNAQSVIKRNAAENTVVFNNTEKRFDVRIAKVDENDEFVTDAVMQIIEKDNEDNVLAEWVTENDYYTAKIPQGTYILREKQAPFGYLKAEDIEFTVGENGNLNVGGVSVDEIKMVDKPIYLAVTGAYGVYPFIIASAITFTMLLLAVVIKKRSFKNKIRKGELK